MAIPCVESCGAISATSSTEISRVPVPNRSSLASTCRPISTCSGPYRMSWPVRRKPVGPPSSSRSFSNMSMARSASSTVTLLE